jgi:hypothetical protein
MDGGFRLFDLDGRIISTVGRAGIFPFDALPGCRDDWVTYGYGGKGGLPGSDEEWLQRLRFDASGIAERGRILADSSPPGQFAYGKQYGLARGDGEYAVLHEHGDPPQLLRWSCARQRPRTARENVVLAPAAHEGANNARRITVEPGGAVPAGMTLVADGLLTLSLQSREVAPDSGMVITQFQLVTADSVHEVFVAGRYRLRGARYGYEVLIESDQPSPHLLLVPEASLLDAVRSGGGRRFPAAS